MFVAADVVVRRGRMSSSRTAVALLLLTSISHAAEDDRPRLAAQKFESGMAHYHLQEWDEAIAAWQAGFRIKPAPEFLYNIAQAYRLSKRADKALQYYETYLRMEPKAPNRADIEKHMAALRKLITQQQTTANLPPTDPKPSPPSFPEVKPEPAPPPPPPPKVETPKPAEPLVVQQAPPPKPKSRAWIYGVAAGAVAVVTGAVALGVALGVDKDPSATYGTVQAR
jgi:iron complex outermembrane receptor protein